MTDDLARRRLLQLTAVRLGGSLMLLFGLFLLMRPDRLSDDPRIGSVIAGLVMLAGLAELVIVPRLLRKSWGKGE
jgi:drug/metabolite transporter (DMT)-like permease